MLFRSYEAFRPAKPAFPAVFLAPSGGTKRVASRPRPTANAATPLLMVTRLVWLLTVVFTGLPALSGATPPHLVLFLSDDHSVRDSSVYGSAEIRTPAMEQLAREGMTFDQAFAASPTCAPSRAALLTGLMPARNGAQADRKSTRLNSSHT